MDKLINKYLVSEASIENEIENAIRDHLSGTNRKTTKKLMYPGIKKTIKGVSPKLYNKVWDSLVDDGYLVNIKGDTYKWEG